MSRFHSGNKKTLLEDTQKNKINLREELKAFYSTYYISKNIKVALEANLTLDKLEKLGRKYFKSVRNDKK